MSNQNQTRPPGACFPALVVSPSIIAWGLIGTVPFLFDESNKHFPGSGDMVLNKLCWEAGYTVGLPNQKNL